MATSRCAGLLILLFHVVGGVILGRPWAGSKTRGINPASDEVSRSRAVECDVVRIGTTLSVPQLAVGTIAWTPERKPYVPGDAVVSKADTAAKQRALAQLALGKGLTFFDTAERYSVGAGERLLAEAVRDGRRRPIIATKFTPVPWRLGPEAVVEACCASRERLGVDVIDLYQLHMPDIVQPFRVLGYVNEKDEDYWEGLARCVELGLCREIGVSNYGPTRLRACHDFLRQRGIKLATNQIHYSLLARHGGNQAAVDAGHELGVSSKYCPQTG